MKKRLENLLKEALAEIDESKLIETLLRTKTKYLGRKGEITSLLKGLGAIAKEERRHAGELINSVKARIEEEIAARLSNLDEKSRAERLAGETLDVTLPGRRTPLGRPHPITQVLYEVEDIFSSLGFGIAEGPEVELDYYNFEALNIPKDHPAREMQDTFYISPDTMLRTHTSPVQIRVMEDNPPPLRVIAPGTVFRRDSDITHTPMFHQVEGFMVDHGATFSNLKASWSTTA